MRNASGHGTGHVRWVGAALIAAAGVANPPALAALATSDGDIADPLVRGALWAIAAALLVAGVWILARGRLPHAGRLALVALGGLVAWSAAELALGALERARSAPRVDPRSQLSPYRDADWAPVLWEELGPERGTENHFVYHPHIGWKLRPFDGRHVRIDAHGIRHTWRPPGLPAGAPQVYVFGGSSVWGMGARDDRTLPSELARALAKRGLAVGVHNYGQLAYTYPRNQDLFHLLLTLRDGHRPDHVVLVHGANDVYAAYLHGQPAGTIDIAGWNESQAVFDDPPTLFKMAVGRVLDRSRVVASLRGLLDPSGPAASHGSSRSEAGAQRIDAQLRELARAIADDYAASLEMMSALADGYGFDLHAFWQPVLFTEATLLDEERGLVRERDEPLERLHRQVLGELRARELAHFADLSNALSGRSKTAYIDYRHLSESGNARLAARIADALEPSLAPGDAAPSTASRIR